MKSQVLVELARDFGQLVVGAQTGVLPGPEKAGLNMKAIK